METECSAVIGLTFCLRVKSTYISGLMLVSAFMDFVVFLAFLFGVLRTGTMARVVTNARKHFSRSHATATNNTFSFCFTDLFFFRSYCRLGL